MTGLAQRQLLVKMIHEAESAGAGRGKACQVVGICIRTLQRWSPLGSDEVKADQRPEAVRPAPSHQLTTEEKDAILAICHEPEYASLPPSQIVPKLADKGIYLASESSFYRVLKAANQLHHRGRSQKPKSARVATTHTATAPNQVWTWDVTWLPSTVTGRFFYLYMVEDLYSRYGVVWEVHEAESADLAAELMQKGVWREKLTDSHQLVLHSDNGSMMKAQTLRVKLDQLNISQSFSRPRVSDDNAYVESFFRTLKYGPSWPSQGFTSLDQAREWVQQFMQWYNHEHQHSKIRFVTPAQRHRGDDRAVLTQRASVYAQAKQANPARWSGNTRDWSVITEVTLNPERPAEGKKAA